MDVSYPTGVWRWVGEYKNYIQEQLPKNPNIEISTIHVLFWKDDSEFFYYPKRRAYAIFVSIGVYEMNGNTAFQSVLLIHFLYFISLPIIKTYGFT